MVLVEGKEGELERDWRVMGEDVGEGILKVGRAQTSGAGGDRQRCKSSCKPKTVDLSFSGGENRPRYARHANWPR